MSIKKTLRLTLIAFSIIPMTIITIFAYRLVSDRLLSYREENLSQLAITNSNGLKKLINNQKNEISLLAVQKELSELVLNNNSSRLNFTNNKEVTKLLKTYCNMYPDCESISLYNKNFKIISSSSDNLVGYVDKNNKTLNYLSSTGDSSYATDYITLSDKNKITYCTQFGSPILDKSNDNVVGYVVSTINLSYFRNFLDTIKIGNTGHVILINSGGNILYHPDKKLIGTSIQDNELKSVVVDYYNGSKQKNSTFKHNYNNKENIFSYSVIPDLNWVFFVKQETEEVNNPTAIMFFVLLWGLVITLLFLLAISSRVTRYFTTPILELRDKMKIAASGNLNVTSNTSINNEFGELSKNFNSMIHIIKNNYDDLTEMHNKLIDKEEELHINYEKITYLAYHDVLTKLPNKLSFCEMVNDILDKTIDESVKHAVLFVDLDNFKTINDTLGHNFGDELLIQTSLKLNSIISDKNVLARAGGDEFLIFCTNIVDEDDVCNYALDILKEFNSPLRIHDEIIYISMSIGIAIFPDNGNSCDVLMKNADIAMYKSKDTGKNKLTVFNKSMEVELSRNTEILEVLRHAIENNEVFLMYQPQVAISTKEVIGFEALMRIYNPKLGLISPGEFIPIAEESGLIVALGTWALKEACNFTKDLLTTHQMPCRVSVNISSVQLNKTDFFSTLTEILDETDLPPECLELEITESTLLSSIMDTTTLLKNFQSLGVKIALDDFGTGFSSLNYLTRIPINTLKIDKSFIDNICTSKKDIMIAETIIRLAHNLEIKVIAEGVEDTNQLQLLENNQCDLIQGYLFSRPLSSNDLSNFLNSSPNK